MLYYQLHPEIFDLPILLTEQEKETPLRVIEEFFEDYKMSEIRDLHQRVHHICLTEDAPPFDEGSERDRLIVFRERIEKLLEAAWLLSTMPHA